MKKIKILIAPDSFKNCLTANAVAKSIRSGLVRKLDNAIIDLMPVSDGGEGFYKLFTMTKQGRFQKIETLDALGRKISAEYGIIESENTVVLDVASATGLELLQKKEQNPLKTSSLGTGIMLKHAVESGFKRIIVGLGGSSTTDGGIGIASAFGYKFLDANNNPIELNGNGLKNLRKIDMLNIFSFNNIEIIAACDVVNLLLGKNGAAFTFSRQKGASTKEIFQLEQNLHNLASIIKRDLKIDITNLESGGAAGGIGAGLKAFCKAHLISGIKLFLEQTEFVKKIKTYDVVITGEGKIDKQTLSGKAPYEIAKIARENDIPVIVVTGKLIKTELTEKDIFYDKIFQLSTPELSESETIKNAEILLQKTGEKIAEMLLVPS